MMPRPSSYSRSDSLPRKRRVGNPRGHDGADLRGMRVLDPAVLLAADLSLP
jgi:hypothetical protein